MYPDTVLHLASLDRWRSAESTGSDYTDPSLQTEGFIHCSTREQVLIPANERFRGRDDLVVLVVDPELVPAATVFEDCYDSGLEFPHIYGPIPLAAVRRVVPFPCEPDGSFALPAGL